MPKIRSSQAVRLLSQIAAVRRDVATLTKRLNTVLAVLPSLPADATAAAEAREAGKARGFFWVAEFAAVIGHHRQFVSDRCAARVIRTLKGGKPYRIPLEELTRWNGGAA